MGYNVNAITQQQEDYTTTLDISDGDVELIVRISTRCSIVVDIVSGQFQYPVGVNVGTDLAGTLDATVNFNQSTDGINSQSVDGADELILDTADKKGGWQKDNFEPEYAHILINQNNVTSGTVRVLIGFKPINNI